MDFKDFKPEELVGKIVVYNDGFDHQRISTIDRITKTCFGIKHNAVLFKLVNGYERGGDGHHQASCRLVTDDQANTLRAEWAIKKRIKLAIESIEHEVRSGRPTVDQLEAACVALGLVKS